MAISRIVKFEIPKHSENLINIVMDKFDESGISTVDMLQYMLDNDINNCMPPRIWTVPLLIFLVTGILILLIIL